MKSTAPVRPVSLDPLETEFEHHPDGTIIARAVQPLGAYPHRLTERLEHFATVAPDRVYLARRAQVGPTRGEWQRITYAEAFSQARAIGAALLARGLTPERPVAILSGNSLEHALLVLGCLHVGIPFTAISVAYSLVSTDFGKLRHIFSLATPGLVFVEDATPFAAAIAAVVPDNVELVCVRNPPKHRAATAFAALLVADPEPADAAAVNVGRDHIAKLLFTSGSTGMPKGVITTQGMLCANQQMIAQTLTFLTEEPPVLVDWTPWNHVFGGSHDFGLILYNGGTLYIDDGKPVPGAVEESIRNLREISPTFYLNVPKGFEELVAYLKREPALRETFFARVKLVFYAGAALAQHVIDDVDALAVQTTGTRIQWMAGFGATETSPYCLVCRADCVEAGVTGLPAPGVEMKLSPVGDKLEARVRGPHVTPGYWRNAAQTTAAFDEEGWYRLGDAMRWHDPARPELGFAFDGRITEDFKLATGTWVSVGPLRARLTAALAPALKDVVIAGINRDFLTALIVPDVASCRALCPGAAEPLDSAPVRAFFRERLQALADHSTGSSTRIVRAVILRDPPDIDSGEITDKGSLNQRAVLARRASLVDSLYDASPAESVISVELRRA